VESEDYAAISNNAVEPSGPDTVIGQGIEAGGIASLQRLRQVSARQRTEWLASELDG
jgi:hypothetical protein